MVVRLGSIWQNITAYEAATMATIQTRKGVSGESYRVGYYDSDGKFKFTPTMKNYAGAERIAAIIEKQGYTVALKVLGVQQRSQKMTLEEWFRKHLERKAINIEDGTIAGYEAEAARTWLPLLGDYPLDTITKDAVIEWVAWQMKQPTARSLKRYEREKAAGVKKPAPVECVSPKTVRNAHGLLSSVLQSAVDDNEIPKNVAKGVPVPEDLVREEKAIFDREEWDRFYVAMADYYKPFIAFLLVTGCRIGEATAVRVGDLNFKANSVSIVRAWKKARTGQTIGTPKSRRSRRVILVDQWAMDAFKTLTIGRDADEILFLAPRGGRIYAHRFLERQWTDAMRKAELDKHLTPHSLRHTFASWQLMDGTPAQVVQMRMGHESLATTSTIYAHLMLADQASGVAALGWEPPATPLAIES
jgi:integrase